MTTLVTTQATAVSEVLGPVRQLGYVVENLDAAVAAWSDRLGIGPWMLIKNIPLASVYRGTSSTPVIDIALGYRGELQIELIEQTNDAPSPYVDYIRRGQFGLHHTAFMTETIATTVAALRQAGLEIECDIQMPTGGRYIYFASPVPGEKTFIELLEATPQNKALIAEGTLAAARWDGSEPPTVIDFAALATDGAAGTT